MKPILFSFVVAIFAAHFAHADLIRVSTQTLTNSNISITTITPRNVKLCTGWSWDQYGNGPVEGGQEYTSASIFSVDIQVSGKVYKLPPICHGGDPNILSYLVAIKNGQVEQKNCKISETCDSAFGTQERQYYVDLLTDSAGRVTDYMLNVGPWSVCR